MKIKVGLFLRLNLAQWVSIPVAHGPRRLFSLRLQLSFPIQRSLDDKVQIVIFWGPVQCAVDFIHGGNQGGRVASTAGMVLNLDGCTVDTIHGIYHLPHTIAMTVPAV